MILCKPLFFLLLDSFFESSLPFALWLDDWAVDELELLLLAGLDTA